LEKRRLILAPDKGFLCPIQVFIVPEYLIQFGSSLQYLCIAFGLPFGEIRQMHNISFKPRQF
jgi:hypothetical protein